MGTDHDDPHAARRAKMEELFTSLPAAGTPDYWWRIEQATQDTALPLEVLARCVRERAHAGARDQAERIFRVIMGRTQRTVQFWVSTTVRARPRWEKQDLAKELEQECHVAVWKELIDNERTWFYENFTHRLERVMSHVAHSFMERNGFWKRHDVEKPNRVPANKQDSLDKPMAPGEQFTLGASIPDPAAANEFERAEFEADIAALKSAFKPEDYDLLHDLVFGDLTQKEIAERLQKTDRTVRKHIERLREQLRRDYLGGEEDDHDE